jgi:hypothetical protein
MKHALFIFLLAAFIAPSFGQVPTNMDSLMSTYWQRIVQIQKTELDAPELAVPIDTGASLSAIETDMHRFLQSYSGIVKDLAADTSILRNHFETIALGLPNTLTYLKILLAQQKVEFLRKYLWCCPSDSAAWKDFTAARDSLEHLVRTELLAD